MMLKALPEIRNQAGLFFKVHLTIVQAKCKIDFTIIQFEDYSKVEKNNKSQADICPLS